MQSSSIIRKPTCWFAYQQALTVIIFPPVLQLRPECSRAPR